MKKFLRGVAYLLALVAGSILCGTAYVFHMERAEAAEGYVREHPHRLADIASYSVGIFLALSLMICLIRMLRDGKTTRSNEPNNGR